MKIVALDADGVLLNYNRAYPRVWKEAFNVDLELKRPGYFHAYNEYDCLFQTPEQKQKFYDAFTEKFWEDMPLCEGALEACTRLVEAQYELVCVTSMPTEFEAARQRNLVLHNLPISRTYATGRDRSIKEHDYNPKADILAQLKPVAFVDDYGGNFHFGNRPELQDTFTALIDRNQPDSPNASFMHLADKVFANLQEFVTFFLAHAHIVEDENV